MASCTRFFSYIEECNVALRMQEPFLLLGRCRGSQSIILGFSFGGGGRWGFIRFLFWRRRWNTCVPNSGGLFCWVFGVVWQGCGFGGSNCSGILGGRFSRSVKGWCVSKSRFVLSFVFSSGPPEVWCVSTGSCGVPGLPSIGKLPCGSCRSSSWRRRRGGRGISSSSWPGISHGSVVAAADQHLGQFNRLFLRGANHAPARGTGSELVPQNRRRARTPTTRGHYLCERAISRQKGICVSSRVVWGRAGERKENEREAWITYQPRSTGNGLRRRDLWVLESAAPATLARAWQGRECLHGAGGGRSAGGGPARPCRNPILPPPPWPPRLIVSRTRGVLRVRRRSRPHRPKEDGERRDRMVCSLLSVALRSLRLESV